MRDENSSCSSFSFGTENYSLEIVAALFNVGAATTATLLACRVARNCGAQSGARVQ